MTTGKMVLIDGHALAYRMFFALPLESFTTKSGEPTNATYGFTRTLLDLILASEPPEYLAVSFDLGATFRDDLFEAYKGTREKMPDELSVQVDRIRHDAHHARRQAAHRGTRGPPRTSFSVILAARRSLG